MHIHTHTHARRETHTNTHTHTPATYPSPTPAVVAYKNSGYEYKKLPWGWKAELAWADGQRVASFTDAGGRAATAAQANAAKAAQLKKWGELPSSVR
jgi:hypothetical protein